jgi:hypothetical protein
MGIDREPTDHHIEKEVSLFLSLKFQEGNVRLSNLDQTMDAGCNIQNNLNAFFCRLDDLKTLVDLMNCLYIDVSKDSECDIEVTPESFFLRVTGKGRCVQGRVSIGLELFEEFYCDVEGVTFTVSLSNFIDCLKLFGTSLDTTTAALSFSRADALFKISLEETQVVTICELSTLFADDADKETTSLLTIFRHSAERCQIIFKSDPLKDAINELADSLWLDSIELSIGKEPAELRLATGGTVGTSEVLFPGDADVFVAFRCVETIREVFPIKSFLLSMKALSVAKETFLRINGEGVLCVQHQVESKRGGVVSYIDFVLLSEQDV